MRRASLAFMLAGIATAVLGLSKVHASVIADPAYDFTSSFRFPWAIAFAVVLGVAAYATGLPDLPRRPLLILATSMLANGIGLLAISVLQLAVGSALLPRFVLGGTIVVLAPWLAFCVMLAHSGRTRASNRDRVVVIGAQEDSTGLTSELDDNAERDARVMAILTPDEARSELGRAMPVRDAVEAHGANGVVLERVGQAPQLVVDQVAQLHETGVRVRTLSLFYEEWLGKLPIGELERVSLMFDIGEIHRLRYGRVKRLLDLAVGLAMVPVLVAVIPLVWIVNLVANRGPLFYSQPRVGKNGSDFRIYKFRTMRPDGGAAEWTGVDDDRVTPFGAVLRSTHLDELPQVLNILRGELSLVGPRPEQPRYVEELEAKLPYYQLRHLVRPGLTGWAQVKFGYARSEGDALEKLQYEFFYLRRQSLALDLRILARTLRTVLPSSRN